MRKRKAYVPKAFLELGLSEPIESIDLQSLYNILSFKRAAGGEAELRLIARYILPTGAVRDEYGNYHKHILRPDGTESKVMWSSHTDTVEKVSGNQKLYINVKGVVSLDPNDKTSHCLGADDGAGVWLMLEMIKKGVPGYYIFHREEETGRHGSTFVAEKYKESLGNLQYSIAFDRKEFNSVITHQTGLRTCSDEFAESIAAVMDMGYEIDKTGSFTDTYSYAGIIPECTNLSVGYTGAHSFGEKLDVAHVLKMRDRLVKFDEDKLVAARDPSVKVYDRYPQYQQQNNGTYTGYHSPWHRQWNDEGNDDFWDGEYGSYAEFAEGQTNRPKMLTEEGKSYQNLTRMARIISNHAWHIAELLKSFGYDADTLYDELFDDIHESAITIGSGKRGNARKAKRTTKLNEEKPATIVIADSVTGEIVSTSVTTPTTPTIIDGTHTVIGPDKPKVFKHVNDNRAQSPAELLAEQVAIEAEKLMALARASDDGMAHPPETVV